MVFRLTPDLGLVMENESELKRKNMKKKWMETEGEIGGFLVNTNPVRQAGHIILLFMYS